MTEPLFVVPDPEPEPLPDTPPENPTAQDVKDALRKRHPGFDNGGMVGQWTCIAEYRGIDLLALNAWRKADVIGYEVKVSRSDLRRELLKPYKRLTALAVTTEFYLAVPVGLLSDEEVAYEEPDWDEGDFERTPCPGVPQFGRKPRREWLHRDYGGQCSRWQGRTYTVPVPIPDVIVTPDWMKPWNGEAAEAFQARVIRDHRYLASHRVPCWNCGGKGYLEKSRVEREAPVCWVPRDVGLVTVSTRGCHVAKPSPKRKTPDLLASSRQSINDLVRWVSHRPDPRHR